MNSITNLLLFLGGLAVVTETIRRIATLMLNKEIKPIQDRFTLWWREVANIPERKLPCVIFRKISQKLDSFFGLKLKSYFSFKRSSFIAFPLLTCTMLLLAVFNKQQFLITPWVTFHSSLQTAKNLQEPAGIAKDQKMAKQVHDKLVEIAGSYDNVYSATVFTIIFYITIAAITLIGFYLASILSRRLLRSLAATEDRFVIFGLMVFVTVVTFFIVTVSMFVIGTLGNPIGWALVLMAIFLSFFSLKVAFVVVVSSGVVTWLLSPISLVVLSLVIFSPLVLSFLIIVGAMVVHFSPGRFYSAITRILKLCTEQNPLVVLATVSFLATSLFASLIQIICWIL